MFITSTQLLYNFNNFFVKLIIRSVFLYVGPIYLIINFFLKKIINIVQIFYKS
jgi:hypothetical protein